MKFKSWRDFYIFVRDYAKYSCLNCQFCGKNLDVDDESLKDGDYARHFCSYFMAMVRWDIQPFVCVNWKSEDGDPLPEDDDLFLLDEHILKKLEKGSRKWSIEEIRELL